MLDVDARPRLSQALPLSLQHLFAMFGATVLVPFIFKIDPSISIFMNGVGTLLYLVVCRGKIPAYLGSSFAFIAPVTAILANPELGGYGAAQGAFVAFGCFFVAVSALVKVAGTRWLDVMLPPAVMGAVVAIIGLELAPVAANMAGFTGEVDAALRPGVLATSLVTLAVTATGAVVLRGFLAMIPVLLGVVAGYVTGIVMGLVDLSVVANAPWWRLPAFSAPTFEAGAVIMILPAAFVVLAEHIGHLAVTGEIIRRDLMRDPGLARSLFADGCSNILSGFVGATPNTTYGENIGVMAMTKVYSVWVIGGAAVIAIGVAFCGKLSALVSSIPTAAMGGVCFMLFGVIAVAGIRMLIERRVDYALPENVALTSVVLVAGLSGTALKFGTVEVKGMALATFAGIALSLVFAALRRVQK